MPRPNQSGKSDRYSEYEQYDKYQDDNLQENLAGLPLPGPTLVIDLRPINQRNSSLLWNLETEIEDLAAEMRLHQVARWRYLAECMNFLRVDTLTPNVSLDKAKELAVVTHTDEFHCSTIEELMEYITDEFVNSVRNSRAGAVRDHAENNRPSMKEEPGQSTVRVFLLIDMMNTLSFTNAILFSHYLKMFNYSYDDPHSTGRDERISTIAICMNANQEHRQEMMIRELSNVNTSRTKFDMIILIQKYRNDDTYIGEGIQTYEVDLVLYTLLLVSSEQLSDAWNGADEQDMSYYVTHIDQELEKVPPTPIYMLGLAVTEYSARWGRRWLDYGLASQIISTLRSTTNIGSDDSLLRFSLLDKRNWFDEWWAEAQVILPESLDELLPAMKPLGEMQRSVLSLSFQGNPLSTTMQPVQAYCEQLDEDYKKLEQPSSTRAIEASRQPELLSEMLRSEQFIRDRQTIQPDQSPDTSLEGVLMLQKRAEQFFSSLFRGAEGTLPRARRQLIMLRERISEIEKVASVQFNIYALHREFTQAGEKAQREVRARIPGSLPILGVLTRISTFILLIVVCVGLLCWFGLAAWLPIIWTGIAGHHPSEVVSFQNPFFITLMGLRLCIFIVLLGVFWYVQHRQVTGYEEKRRSIAKQLQGVSQQHIDQVRNILAARIALSLLEQAGLYAPLGNPCRANQYLQRLDEALIKAQEEAEEQQQDAQKHLKPGLSEREIDLIREQPWINLYVRRDLLPFEQIESAFEVIARKFSQGTPALNAFATHLLRQMESHSSARKPLTPVSRGYRPNGIKDEIQLQALGSELAAAMILSQAIDYDLTQVQVLVERYLQLRERTTQQISAFMESITSLQEEVKRANLEQIAGGSRQRENRFQSTMKVGRENFFLQPVAETLAAWASSQYQEGMKEALATRSITARLYDNDSLPAYILDDLRTRYSLFGYNNAGQMENDDRFYLLIIPGLATDDFIQALTTQETVQAPSFRKLYFPDGEKLIYLHVHRLHLSSSYLPTVL